MTQLNEAITNDFKRLESWLQGNKLSLNVAKTHSMLLATKQKHRMLENHHEVLGLNIGGNELQVVQNTKYLGVKIGSSLDWKEQIKAVSVKVSRALDCLKHAKNVLPRETLRTLYTGIVEPHFRYFCLVWDCAGSTESNSCKSFRIVLPELLQIAAMVLLVRSFWKNLAGKPLMS